MLLKTSELITNLPISTIRVANRENHLLSLVFRSFFIIPLRVRKIARMNFKRRKKLKLIVVSFRVAQLMEQIYSAKYVGVLTKL